MNFLSHSIFDPQSLLIHRKNLQGILLKNVKLDYSLSWKNTLEERDWCIQIDSQYFHTERSFHIFMGNEFAQSPPWNKPCDPTHMKQVSILRELRPNTAHWVPQNTGLIVIPLMRTPEFEKEGVGGELSLPVWILIFLFLFLDYPFVPFEAVNCWSSISVQQLLSPICLDLTQFSYPYFNFYLSNLPHMSFLSWVLLSHWDTV